MSLALASSSGAVKVMRTPSFETCNACGIRTGAPV